LLGACGAILAATAPAHAGPLQSVIDHVTGHKAKPPVISPPPAIAATTQARCYGRYVALRDALADAIRNTNAWPSAEPAAEFDKIQASFAAQLTAERSVTFRPPPDFDETSLPVDIRAAYDRGADEAKARLSTASDLRAGPGATGPERMAQLQSGIETAFAPLRTPCVKMIEARRLRRAPTGVMPVHNDQGAPNPAVAAAQGGGDETPDGLAEGWDGREWIQIGVFNRADESGQSLTAFRERYAKEAQGLSEKTEDVSRGGKVTHIALVGPFASAADARAFCARLTARGETCSVRKPPGAAKKPHRVHTAPRHGAQPLAKPLLVANQNAQGPGAALRGRMTP
jgi:hypothetical protein